MQALILSYRNSRYLGFVSEEVLTIGRLKKLVDKTTMLATHVDVYLGRSPSLHKGRVRRVSGFWSWKGLEIAAREAGLCRP
jgi:hypothetical protein